MEINLIENEREFEQKDINEIKGFLSKLPFSHLNSLNRIERLPILRNAYADSSPEGRGEQIRLPDDFYHLDANGREFVFLHEMGHNYFDYRDEYEGDRSLLRCCKKEDVSHLLRIRWMKLGKWELNPRRWKIVKANMPKTDSSISNKYSYMIKYDDPNYKMGEWMHPKEGRIPKISGRYEDYYYSPKEEMADAYALFATDKDIFEDFAKRNNIVNKKYNFMAECFKEDGESGGKIVLRKQKVPGECL